MFITVYQREPHARQMSFKDIAQPTTYAERCALAKRTNTELGLLGTMLIDTMEDTSRAFFGDLPTPAIVIGRDGLVKVKMPWAEPTVLGPRLKKILGAKTAEPTTPREAVVNALSALHAGRKADAAKMLGALTRKWSGPAGLRPIALRAYAACVEGKARAEACTAAAEAAKRVFEGPRLKAALAEIAALKK